MLHDTLVGELCPKIWKMPYPCDHDADGDNGARAERAILAISHITSDGRTDIGTDGEGSLWASRTPVAARTF